MEVICEKKREINTTTSCKKVFCCKKMEDAFKDRNSQHDCYYSNFHFRNNKIRLEIRNEHYGDSDSVVIHYCPFCGKKISVEHIEIDNTGLPPEPEQPVLKMPKKKTHWWS